MRSLLFLLSISLLVSCVNHGSILNEKKAHFERVLTLINGHKIPDVVNLNSTDPLTGQGAVDSIDSVALEEVRTIMREVPIQTIITNEGFIAFTLKINIGARSGLLYYLDEKKPGEVNTGGLRSISQVDGQWYYWAL